MEVETRHADGLCRWFPHTTRPVGVVEWSPIVVGEQKLIRISTREFHRLQVAAQLVGELDYPYPTLHGAIGEALGAHGRGIGTVIDPRFQPLG